MVDETVPDTAKGRCPLCGKARAVEFRPFCSRRCADIDLSRWLKGTYAIPVTEDEDEDGEDAAGEPRQDPERR